MSLVRVTDGHMRAASEASVAYASSPLRGLLEDQQQRKVPYARPYVSNSMGRALDGEHLCLEPTPS